MTTSSKHFTIRATDGEAYYVIGDVITFKVTAEESEGAYLIVEVESQPGGGPFFLHTHEPQETFYVLEGVFEVYGQDENGEKYAIRAEVGDTVQVPANVPHGFRNVGTTRGRMMLMYEPAEPMRNFFKEVGIPMANRHTLPDLSTPPDSDKIMSILNKYMTLIEQPPSS